MALQAAVEVPHDRLSSDALRSLAEEFVTREGTDYGAVERSFEAKVQALLRQIASGEAVVLFDGTSNTTHVVQRDRRVSRERCGRARTSPAN
jgi:uncharacterized protein YheU (UPF0270 family)